MPKSKTFQVPKSVQEFQEEVPKPSLGPTI